MRMYDMMLFFALLGAVSGAIDGLMANGDSWFDSYTSTDMTSVVIDTDDRYEMGSLQSNADEGSMGISMSVMMMLWGTIKGVFAFGYVLNDIFYVADENGSNMFWPVIAIFQAGIWLIYAIGIFQMFTGRVVKGME